jgi:peptidoglycan/xylan/chitin deacetylase (PgdA/CDA1 family)
VGLGDIVRHIEEGSPLPKRWVCLTFDDARLDNLTVAEPIAAEHDYTMTVFAVSGWTDGAPGPACEETPTGPEATINGDGLRQMAERGHTIGSHTVSHPRLTRLDDEAVRWELARSRESLGAVLGAPPEWLAYPYGSIAPRIMDIARQCGYRGAVSTIRDNSVKGANPMALPRVMVQPGTGPLRLRYMMSPLYSWIHRLKNRRRWSGMRNP